MDFKSKKEKRRGRGESGQSVLIGTKQNCHIDFVRQKIRSKAKIDFF